MMKCTMVGSLVVLALSASACREPAVQDKAGAAKPGQVTPEAPPLVALPAPDPELARLPLAERFAMEASARPELAIRPEQLNEALRARGVAIAQKRQVLASTLGASYCELATTSEGLAVAVCEYTDAAHAQAGSARSHQQFDALLPGRTLVTRDNTLLTITRAEGEAAERQAEQVLAAFAEQRPEAVRTTTALAH